MILRRIRCRDVSASVTAENRPGGGGKADDMRLQVSCVRDFGNGCLSLSIITAIWVAVDARTFMWVVVVAVFVKVPNCSWVLFLVLSMSLAWTVQLVSLLEGVTVVEPVCEEVYCLVLTGSVTNTDGGREEDVTG
jgi:hypothetical protein